MQHDYNRERPRAGSTVRARRSSINLSYYSIPSHGHGQDASASDSPAAAAREYAQGAPGTERPYGPETASVASEGKGEERHFRQSHCHDSNAAPYTFVLMLDMVREAREDQSWHRQDV